MTEEWGDRAHQLADKLTDDGDLHSPQWRAAMCAVPRHELVPRYYEQDGAAWRLVAPNDESSRRVWLDRVYSDTTLITAVASDPTGRRQIPISSSTKPDLMIRMLEELNVQDGHRLLEIGTGTGYNAALLTHRLGAQNVFSIDLCPELVDTARERLARMGYWPFLKVADGRQGLPEHAPYDRIIATCSVSAIPPAWIEQTESGGRILVDVEGQLCAGNLVTLRRDEAPVVHGKFLDWYGRFMALRHDVTNVGYRWPQLDRSNGGERTTTVDPSELDGEFRFLAQFRLPPNTRHTLSVENDQPTATCLTNLDGSWCAVDRNPESPGRYRMREDGPQELWSQVEEAHSEWLGMGRPAWHHFGLTATLTTQRIWLDSPDSEHTWELPC